MNHRAICTWYRADFVRGRRHKFHERVVPLVARFVVPQLGLSWLAGDREAFAAWLAAISGDMENAGVLGEIIMQADGESVARNLGAGDHMRLPTARATPLHEKLLIGIRYLLTEGGLPLNRNGAAGWLVGEDLWLVSKRIIDALRAHLTGEGHVGIPSSNDRIFDVLQEHALLIPCGDRAIWRAAVAGDGWQHELTLLRLPARKVWPDPGARPDPFQGKVIPLDSAAHLESGRPGRNPVDEAGTDVIKDVQESEQSADPPPAFEIPAFVTPEALPQAPCLPAGPGQADPTESSEMENVLPGVPTKAGTSPRDVTEQTDPGRWLTDEKL